MPPKSPKGGKKLSKAEKERLKREEAEKKLVEDEEAAKQAEIDAVAKKETDKVEAEERRRLENEERKKRKGQLHELEELWSSYRSTLFSEQAERRVKAKWERFMKCDGSPDPTIPGEINAYINLLREDHSKDDIHTVLKESKLILALIDELQFLIDDTPPDENTEEKTNRYRETIKQMEDALKEKLDLASHDLSLQATKLIDAETLNLQQTIPGEDITLCMWGNLSHNPRIKSFEFEEKGFQFEMPKLLTLSDIAIRVLFTKFDHHSPYNKSFCTRVKDKLLQEATTVKEGDEAEGEKKEGEEEEEKKKEGEEGAEGISREETEIPEEEEEEIEKVDSPIDSAREPEEPEKKDVMAALRGLEEETKSENGEEKKEEEPEEQVAMEEDYEIRTPEPVDFVDFDGDDDVIDLRAFHVVGGVFYFNLLNMPPQPKQANAWTITQVVEPPELSFNDYEGDPPVEAAKEEDKDEDITKAADKLLKNKDQHLPIGITMQLPKGVYFFEEPQVVRFNNETKEWKTDGFTDHSFKEEERIFSFKTRFFGTMALVQDKHINMPFQSWEIRPKGPNHVVISIIAAIVEVEMEIKDDKIRLTQPEEGKWMCVKDFVKKMQLSGINLFPDEDSHKYVSIQNKNSITEERLYQQMAMVASSMAFSWSRWNSDCKDIQKIVIQGSEHLVDEPLLEEDWSLFMVTKKRTTKLKMSEFDETFSEDHAEGTEFHADLYHMTMDIISEPGQARIRETNHRFVDAIYQFLKATNLVTYS